MCGIAGIFNFKRPVKNIELNKMLEATPWRGPDSSGIWSEKNVGFSHNRLSIFDLSKNGNQPMQSRSGNSVITFNGEIYNWIELRKELPILKWKSLTDTETLLEAYEIYGTNVLKKINGMFSFAIWDKKKKFLFVARDRVGIKPFYWSFLDKKFIFGSEIKSILATNFQKNVDMKSVHDFFVHGLIDHDKKTFFKDIHQLEPGHYMIVKKNQSLKKIKYWDLKEKQKETRLNKKNSFLKFLNLYENSVKIQSRADVQIGTLLSGGFDSSVLSFFLKNLGINLKTFTYGFGENDEIALAKNTSKKLGLENYNIILDCKKIPNLINEVIRYQEAPVTSIRVLAMHELYKKIKSLGVKVILEGQGGDEIGAGYEYYYAPYYLDLKKKIGERKAFIATKKLMFKYKNINESNLQRRFFYSLLTTIKPGISTQDGVPFIKKNVFKKDFIQINSHNTFKHKFKSWLKSLQFIDFKHVVLPRALRYCDRVSMASSVESRLPLLDHRIVECSFDFPNSFKIENGKTRLFMQSILDKYNAKGFKFTKNKKTIVDPQKKWLKKNLSGWIKDLFNDDSIYKNYDIFEKKELLRTYDQFMKSENPESSFNIFQYINFIVWLNVYFK